VLITERLLRRLLTSTRTNAADEPSASTLEAFFAEIRWNEDVHENGQRTLSHAL